MGKKGKEADEPKVSEWSEWRRWSVWRRLGGVCGSQCVCMTVYDPLSLTHSLSLPLSLSLSLTHTLSLYLSLYLFNQFQAVSLAIEDPGTLILALKSTELTVAGKACEALDQYAEICESSAARMQRRTSMNPCP